MNTLLLFPSIESNILNLLVSGCFGFHFRFKMQCITKRFSYVVSAETERMEAEEDRNRTVFYAHLYISMYVTVAAAATAGAVAATADVFATVLLDMQAATQTI